MMKVNFKRPPGFKTEGRRQEREIKKYVLSKLVPALKEFQDAILYTPVYTGRTLVNYRWALGNPITQTRAAVAVPDLPGTTSDLGIGSEPRRGANAQIINEEFASMLSSLRGDPFQNIYLNNNLAHFSEVEYGTYAKKAGQESRTPPGGMTRRGEAALRNILGGLLRVT